jgi:hypothetical protein
MAGGDVIMSTTFEDQVQDYLRLRRGLGCRLDGQGKLLLDFGRFLDLLGHRGPITTEVALEWAEAPQSKDPDRTAQRLGLSAFSVVDGTVFEVFEGLPISVSQRV